MRLHYIARTFYFRLNVGDIISDRTTERTKLQAKKQRLEASLNRAKLPLRELKPVPEPKFQTELVALLSGSISVRCHCSADR